MIKTVTNEMREIFNTNAKYYVDNMFIYSHENLSEYGYDGFENVYYENGSEHGEIILIDDKTSSGSEVACYD